MSQDSEAVLSWVVEQIDGVRQGKVSRPVLAESSHTGVVEALWRLADHVEAERARFALAERQLSEIVEGTASSTGEDFFEALVRHLVVALDAPVAFVCERPDPNYARTLAIWSDGGLSENFTYTLEGTPCAQVVGRECCQYPQRVRETFPDDHWLNEVGAECYLGVPFFSSDGRAAGHLGVIDTRAREDTARSIAIMKIFANRAMAELERLRVERALVAKAEALVRSNRDMEQFAYAASHDLREPLRKILMFGQQLIEDHSDHLDEDGARVASRMRDAAQRMDALIEDLLTLSRVAQAQVPRGPVDLESVCREALIDLRRHVGDARVEIGSLPQVEGHTRLMEQLFENLLSNALKFRRPEVQTVVSVTAEDSPKGKGWHRICVEDNGIGFGQTEVDRIFKPFERLNGRSAYPGTGIGLAISRRIVQSLGGGICAEGRLGLGARFMVDLPAVS